MQLDRSKTKYDFITIGKKAREFVTRTGENLIADFSDVFGDELEEGKVTEVTNALDEFYLEGEYDRAKVLYSHYVSAISQQALWRQIYPIDSEQIVAFL